jgi:alkanesulfonate monooxygenase SsuD/methylene tetrahydromethanopterin reductase-like flavin-dependent oxidoreductase (luciferase family)
MRIGIGLPAAVPDADATALGAWAATAERHGFASVGVIDRLVYDNLDPLVALAAAAARTEAVELLTTVLTVPYRRNAVVLAKQLASVERLSGGRLTAGMALGGWPEDYEASGVPRRSLGAAMDAMLATMRSVWEGEVVGASGPIPALPPGRPRILFGGFAPAAFERAATIGHGWVAPSFGFESLIEGIAAVRQAWSSGGRPGRPRVVVERYFSLGDRADETADHYLAHYYGNDYFAAARADTPTDRAHLETELERLRGAGCDDVILLPCSDEISQLDLLADALGGVSRATGHTEPRAEAASIQVPGAGAPSGARSVRGVSVGAGDRRW